MLSEITSSKLDIPRRVLSAWSFSETIFKFALSLKSNLILSIRNGLLFLNISLSLSELLGSIRTMINCWVLRLLTESSQALSFGLRYCL